MAVLFRLDSVEVERGEGLRTYLREAMRRDEEQEGHRALSGLRHDLHRPLWRLYHLHPPPPLEPFRIHRVRHRPDHERRLPLHRRHCIEPQASSLGTFSPERLITYAFALYALSFLAIPFLPGHWLVAIPVALFGVAQGMNYPVVMSLLAGLAPTEHRAIFMSANGMVLRVGQTLGPLIMAGVFAWGGMTWVFYAAMGICIGMFFFLPSMLGRE